MLRPRILLILVAPHEGARKLGQKLLRIDDSQKKSARMLAKQKK